MRYLWLAFAILFSLGKNNAQSPEKLSSNQIYSKLEKLNFLGTVLYIAAHPDDENTRFISYASNAIHANTVYLSLTRGDGGQNLIGPEIRESLGVIRTQELLAARKVDGGSQLFTRANDFGYSKNPTETLGIWDKDKVLEDVVWAIRKVKPDVIVNRFDHRTPGTTHGHHTASAQLSYAAFDMANDKNVFKNHLKYTSTWQPKRLFFNTSWWFYGSREKFKKASKENLIQLNTGVYYPELGLSNNEIAATASSQHLCQGFGRLNTRGEEFEYLEFLKGQQLNGYKNIFEGIDTSWNRVKGGAKVAEILHPIVANFNFKNPAEHVPALVKAYEQILQLEDAHWKTQKAAEIKEIIYACAGLYLEASSKNGVATIGENIPLSIEVLNRSSLNIELTSLVLLPSNKKMTKNISLANNKKEVFNTTIAAVEKGYTSPYWLFNDFSMGMYTVNDQNLIGLPNTPRNLKVVFNTTIEGVNISFEKAVVNKYAKKDKGEIYQPLDVLPKVTVNIADKVEVFASKKPKEIVVSVKANTADVKGSVRLVLPDNWQVSPQNIPFEIHYKGDEQKVIFSVTPPKADAVVTMAAQATVGGKVFENELQEINYSHIPKQHVVKHSAVKAVRLNVKTDGTNIGYLQGAGDVIPESLHQIGYHVKDLKVDDLTKENLQDLDALVLGIRAYNTLEKLPLKQPVLLDYVKKGGTLIVQYNTTWRSTVNHGAPYRLNLSKDRVTDENSEVVFLDPSHQVLQHPNKISVQDFEGWVQERGLYFPNEWGAEFTPVFGMHDKGETQKNGSLLIAHYGKGAYIYTGLSFFRELPAGVPGAYKLFANLLSYKQ